MKGERSAEQGLSIRALGCFDVHVRRHPIGLDAWRLKKAASLFKYLALKQPAWIPREELLETFWGELPPERAERAFRTTIHVLRKVLEPNLVRYAPSRYLEQGDARYRLCPDAIAWFDVPLFEAAVRRFREAQWRDDPGQALAAAREAIDLYGGPLFPEEAYEDWVMPYRELLSQEYLDTVEAFARLTVADPDPATHHEAVQVLRRALQPAPERESLHLLLMQHLVALERAGEALRHFERYARQARVEWGTRPGPEITRLAAGLEARLRLPSSIQGTLSGASPSGRDTGKRGGDRLASVAYVVDGPTFRQIVAWEQRRVTRRGCPSAVIVIRVRPPDAAPGPWGDAPAGRSGSAPAEGLEPWQQAVIERLRRADVATAPDSSSLALLLPETDAGGVERVLDRLRPAIAHRSGARSATISLYLLADEPSSRPSQLSLTLR